MKTRIAIRIEADLLVALKTRAAETRTTVSHVMRDILWKEVSHDESILRNMRESKQHVPSSVPALLPLSKPKGKKTRTHSR